MFAAFYAGRDALESTEMKIVLSISFALMLIANFLVFTAFQSYSHELYSSFQKDLLLTKQKADQQYYDKILQVNEECRALLHDMKHYLSGLRGIITVGDKERAFDYLGNMYERLNSNELIVFSSNPLLDAILTEKKSEADAAGIRFQAEVITDVSFQHIPEGEYIAILGNLLDNAIQGAAIFPQDPYVTVKIYDGNEHKFLTSVIENSCDPSKLKQKNGRFFTTKDKKQDHGFGIQNVKKMTEELEGLFETKINENKFITTIILPL